MNNFYILAHRGVTENGLIDNSLESLTEIKCFKNNIKLGIEFDIQLTSDNKIIIYHDQNLNNKEVEKTTFNELKFLDNNIIEIDEILVEFNNTNFMLNIELKNYSNNYNRLILFVKILEDIVCKYKINYFYSSFDINISNILNDCYLISEDINTENVKITNYNNFTKYKNILGIYTLYDNIDFNESIINSLLSKNIKYLITDNVKKLINYLYKDKIII